MDATIACIVLGRIIALCNTRCRAPIRAAPRATRLA